MPAAASARPAGRTGRATSTSSSPSSEAPQMAGRRQDYFEERLRVSFPQVWELGPGALRRRAAAQRRLLRPPHDAGHGRRRGSGRRCGDVHQPLHRRGRLFRPARGAARGRHHRRRPWREATSAGMACSAMTPRGGANCCRATGCATPCSGSSTPLPCWAGRRSACAGRQPLTEVLLQTVGDLARPADLFSLPTLAACALVHVLTHAHRKHRLHARADGTHLPACRRHPGLADSAAALPGSDRLRADATTGGARSWRWPPCGTISPCRA